MTDVPASTPGAGTLATRQSTAFGKVGDKRFTAQPEPEPGQRSATSLTTRSRHGVLSGVKRLLRAAIQGPSPRAGSPLRQATRDLDAALECLLRTLLGGDSPGGSRITFALTAAVDAEAGYAAAGGRDATPRAIHDATRSDDRPGGRYSPPLEAFTFTDLLLLRERLPRLLHSVAGATRLDPLAAGIIELCLAAVEDEITLRERPFIVVLRLLALNAPGPEDLDGPLCVLACAVSDREKRGESPLRFLGDLAASRNNEELEDASAALASASLHAAYGTASRTGTRGRVAISARDGGACACARILKDALDACIRSRLVIRARLALRQDTQSPATAGGVVDMVLSMLARGVTTMNGDTVPPRGHTDAIVMTLFVTALAGHDGLALHRYLAALSDPILHAFERHITCLPAARRKMVSLAIGQERHKRGIRGHAAPSGHGHTGHLISRTMERVGMQATPILARLITRIQSDLRHHADVDAKDVDARRFLTPSPDPLARMSFDITARTNGEYEVSVTADVVPQAGNEAVSLIYKSRVTPDLRPLRGSFHQKSTTDEHDQPCDDALICHR